MLKAMRKNTKVVLWIVIAAFLGTIVFAWGMNYTGSPQAKNFVAKINGEEISINEYSFVYDQLVRDWESKNPQAELGENQKGQFYYQAWSQLLQNVLTRQQMRRYGISVSDQELVEFLQKYYYAIPQLTQIPTFLTNGVFDYNKYIAAMNSKDPSAGPFWAQIEAVARPQLLEFKLTNMVFSTARLTNDDVVNRYKEYNDYYQVKMVLVRADQFRPYFAGVSEKDLRAEFEKNRDKYRQPERAIIKFVRFSKEPASADDQRVKEEILSIRPEAEGAKDSTAFAEVAKKYSQDPTTPANGGDLGWFGPGRMVPAFDSAVFQLKPGELSGPVRTSFGWHVIKLWGKKKTKEGEQVHAGHILLTVEASSESVDQLKSAADEFSQTAAKEGFEKIAQERKLRLDSSNIFTKEASIPQLGLYPEINEFVFTRKPGTVSPVYYLQNAFAVIKVDRRFPAGLPAFDEIKATVRSDYIKRRSMETSLRTANEIWQRTQKGLSLDSAARFHQQPVKTDLIWGWGAWVPGMGDAPAFIGAVIGAHEKKQKLIPPVPTDLGYILAELLNYLPFDAAKFAAARDSTAQFLMQKRRTDAFNAWMLELKEKSDIKDYRMEVLGANY